MHLIGMAEWRIRELLAKIDRDRAARNTARTYVNVGFGPVSTKHIVDMIAWATGNVLMR